MTQKLEEILNLPNVKSEFAKVDKKDKEKQVKENVVGKNLDPKKHIKSLTKLRPHCHR